MTCTKTYDETSEEVERLVELAVRRMIEFDSGRGGLPEERGVRRVVLAFHAAAHRRAAAHYQAEVDALEGPSA